MKKSFKRFVERLLKEEVSLEEIQPKISDLLKRTLPHGVYTSVEPYKMMSSNYLAIKFAASDHLINGVKGQRPEAVSLSLNDKLELQSQAFGGTGGNIIYTKGFKTLKIPFRKPQPNEKSVLQAIENFAKSWVKTLKDNIDILSHQDIVDYKTLLK